MRRLSCILLLCCFMPAWADDPAPPLFREVWLDTREVPALLGQGSWSLVPYREFAQLRDQAAELERRRKTPPWLTRLQLEARVEGSQLKGLARLQIRHLHPGAAWLNVQPWSPSLLPVADVGKGTSLRAGSEARSLLLRVDQDQQSLTLPVQVGGEERPDGLWFTLQLPASPQSTLTIDVSPGHRLEWPRPRGILTSTGQHRYNITLDGSTSSEVTLVMRKDTAAQPRPYQEARLDAEFQVTGKAVDAKYDLVVQRWHDRIQHLDLTLSAGLVFTQIDWKQGDNLIPVEAKSTQAGRWTVTLPEMVDQRVTLTLRARWPVESGQPIIFHTPQVMQCNTRATLRIQSASERLEHWTWGDFTPQDRLTSVPLSSTTGFALNLVSTGLRTSAGWRSPTVRLAPRQGQQTYQQHSSLFLGRSPVLTVHCQWSSSGKPDLLQWKVPTGWMVETVLGSAQQPRPLWHWKPGSLLEVEVEAGNQQPGNQHALSIKLTPEKPLVEKQPLTLPHLVPQSPGLWNGSYSLRLERSGTLLPSGLTILQPPGVSASPKSGEPSPPDAHWALPDLQSTVTTPGSIRLDPWPPLVQAAAHTELKENPSGAIITYRLRLQPAAGQIVSWPVRWNAAMPMLVWRTVAGNQPVTWQADTPQSGTLQFTEALAQPLELECQQPWDGKQLVPLLIGESDSALLHLPARWKPATPLKPGPKDRTWLYDSTTAPLPLVRLQPSPLQLLSQSLRAKQRDDIVVCQYEAELPAYEESLQLSLPADALLSQCTIHGNSLECSQQNITIPRSDQPRTLKLLYHVPQSGSRAVPLPRWSVEVTPPLTVMWEPTADWLSLSLPPLSQRVPLHWVLAVVLVMLTLVRSLSSRSAVWLSCGLLLLVLCVWVFPGRYLPAAIVLGGLLMLLAPLTLRRRLPLGVLGCLLFLAPHGQAQPGRAPILVYLIAGKTSDPSDALIIVPASALTQLRSYLATEQGRETTGWWVEQVTTQATRQENTIRWTSTMHVRNQSASTITMPWLQPMMPSDISVNGQPSQLRPSNVAFGLLKHAVPIPPQGVHEVKATWTTPLTSETGWLTSPLRWPGCPVQTLTTTGLSGWLKTDSATLPLRDGLLIACGSVTESRLYLIDAPRNTISNAQADVAVHWDHRPQQSTMNVLVSYDFKTIPTDTLLLDLPRTVQVRSINLVGEKQALASPRIQRWQLTPQLDSQRLAIQLQRPVVGHLYLLLELPCERTELAIIPLSGLEVIGLPVRQSFVAWSGDGVSLKLRDAGKPVPRAATRFASAWLPLLASLPDERFLKMQPLSAPAPTLELAPASSQPLLSARSTMVMSEQQLETTTEVGVAAGSPSATLLQGKVPAECKVLSITGPEVLHWQQSSPLADKSTELLVWLDPRSRLASRSVCTIAMRRVVATPASVLLETIAWQAMLAHPEVVHLQATPQISSWKLSSPLPELTGPWPTASQLAALSLVEISGTPVQLTWESAKATQPPSLTLSQNPGEWKLVVQAAPDSTLPDEVQLLVKEQTLQHLWQWDATTGLVSRAAATPDGILWTLRPRAGTTHLTASCSTAAKLPTISLPQWPAVKPVVTDR